MSYKRKISYFAVLVVFPRKQRLILCFIDCFALFRTKIPRVWMEHRLLEPKPFQAFGQKMYFSITYFEPVSKTYLVSVIKTKKSKTVSFRFFAPTTIRISLPSILYVSKHFVDPDLQHIRHSSAVCRLGPEPRNQGSKETR